MSAETPDTVSGQVSEQLDALESENRVLRGRLQALTQTAGRNDALLRKTGDRELELLRAGSLVDLFQLLLVGLRASYELDAMALLLNDPRHEIRHLLIDDGAEETLVNAVQFVDFHSAPAPRFAGGNRPWLGAWRPGEHQPLFRCENLGSVALIPLPRRDQLDGVLGFGSRDPRRFTSELASDFLAHLGVVAAICIENAVNRSRLLRAGYTDFLTGWNNRRYLQRRLAEELSRAQRERSSVACMMIDVDYFKRINDRYGHLAGDAVLRDMAHRIDAVLRESDTRARFGGDEFAIILPGLKLAEGERLAARILRVATGRPLRFGDDGEETITLSIGVATVEPAAGVRDYKALTEQLVAEADAALYRAKLLGRNRVVCAEHSLRGLSPAPGS
jgi:two-component system cell cycle response regulator